MIYIIIILHFIFDWILQPREIAKNKYNNLDLVFKHILINIIPYIILILIINLVLNFENAYYTTTFFQYSLFIFINIFSHALIDWILADFIYLFYNPKDEKRGLINITAIDQILHLIILIFTYNNLII